MLYQRDSASFMLDAIRRHQRLCRKSKSGESLIQAIQSPADNLKAKFNLELQAQDSRQDFYDDVLYLDTDLDNVIRDTFEACKSFDRNNAGSSLLNRIFEDGTFSNIIRLPYAAEPNAAEKLAVKIESLGDTHQLYPFAARIRTAAQNVLKALQQLNEAIRKEKTAEAETQIAKMDLIRAYEINYLDARRQLGATGADRLFPVLPARNNDTANEEVVTESNNKAV